MRDKVTHIVTSTQMAEQCTRDIVQMVNDYGWVDVEIKAGGRSIPQNKTYWMWLEEMAEYINHRNETDFTAQDLHDRMRHQFLGYTDSKKVGSVEIPAQLRSTTDLTKGEMFTYMNQIDMYCAQSLGFLLTTPGDSMYAKMKRTHEVGE